MAAPPLPNRGQGPPAGGLIGLLVVLASCGGWDSERVLRVYEKGLKLEVSLPQSAPGVKPVEVSLRLSNVSATVIDGCLGPGREIAISSDAGGSRHGNSVSHPGCIRQFTLQPGRELRWSEALEAPHRPVAPGTLEFGVQVMDPASCMRAVGCLGTTTIRGSTAVHADAPR